MDGKRDEGGGGVFIPLTPFIPFIPLSTMENAMETLDPLVPLTGVPVIVIVPALIEGAKRAGLPVRFAGLTAVGCAIALLALGDVALAGGTPEVGRVARWLVSGVVYDLAAAGLYSQRHLASTPSQLPTSVGAPRSDAPRAWRRTMVRVW
jgi:hypothetical protein